MVQKKTLINNSVSGIIQLIITALLTFFCIPIFINKLGTELYGVFALVSVIGNLNLFTNLGLEASLTKFIAEQGKGADSEKDIIASLILNILIIVPISCIAFLFRFFLLSDLLKIPSIYLIQAESLFSLLLLSNAILLIGQTLTAALDALHKIYLTNLIQLVYSIIYWLGIIIVVLLGYQLEAIGKILFSASLIWLSLSAFYFFHYWGKIKMNGGLYDLKVHAKKQIKYGIKIYTSGVIAFFNEPLFKIIISNYFGVSAVAYFEIALKVRGQINGLFNKAIHPLFPYISQLTNHEFIANLVKDLTKKIFLLVLPVCVMLILSCQDIVSLWLQVDIVNYTMFIVGITVPYLLFSPQMIPIYLFLMGKGHPGKTVIFQLLTVVVNIASFYLFQSLCGIYTIILSNALAYLASFLLGLYFQNRYLHIKYRINYRDYQNYVILIAMYALIGICQQAITNEFASILFAVVAVSIITIELYKHLNIIKEEDMNHYFSEHKFIISLYNRL